MKQFLFILCLLPVVLKAQIITTVAGTGHWGYSGDGGPAVNAQLDQPTDIFVDDNNNIFISDPPNLRIRKMDALGTIKTIAGTGSIGYSGDGGPATQASFNFNQNVTKDKKGSIYFNDVTSHVIRKIDQNGIISTYAGNGIPGYSGDNGPATVASLHSPTGVTTDNIGNLYIADDSNNRIRKVDTFGTITTIAGNGTFGLSGDGGPAISAQLYLPQYVYADNRGNIFVCDWGNVRVRKINSSGVISTVAGNGNYSYTGDGGLAVLAGASPRGLVADSIGNIYFADQLNNRIRKIDTFGIISTVAGNGQLGFNGDSISATSAKLYYPISVKLDRCGNLYIVDQDNSRIRKVTFNATCSLNVKNENTVDGQIVIWPNPTQNRLTVSGLSNTKSVSVINTLGQTLISRQVSTSQTTIDISRLKEGVYFLSIKDPQTGVATRQKFIKE